MPQTQCPVCHKMLIGNLQCHINSVHLELKHGCSKCDKEFSTKGSLKRHINDVHEEYRTFRCPECPLMFARADTLNKHVMSANSNWKVHGVARICSDCGVEYVAPNHHAAMTRDCHECLKDDPSKHGLLCKCSVCNKKRNEKAQSKYAPQKN